MKKAKTKLSEWQKRALEGGKCNKCGEIKPVLSVDHIIPAFIVDMLDETGIVALEYEKNFQLLCRVCNRFKGNRIDKRNPLTGEILKKLLDNEPLV